MKKIAFVFLYIVSVVSLFAQSKQGHQRVIGTYNPIIDFNVIPAQIDTAKLYGSSCSGMPNTPLTNPSSICDSNGNMLLISNGISVYDACMNLIDGGDTLPPYLYSIWSGGYSRGHQTSIFLPFPNNQYAFITLGVSDSLYNTPLFNDTAFTHWQDISYCHRIDMNANNGAGKVVKKRELMAKDVKLSATQMMACRHSNGIDWWLLQADQDSVNVHTYLIRPDSVIYHGKQHLPFDKRRKFDLAGQMTMSQDGSRWATVSANTEGHVFIADFDRCYGILSQPKKIQVPYMNYIDYHDTTIQIDSQALGICFSPNNEYLYVSKWSHILQYEFSTGHWFTVSPPDTVHQYAGYSYLDLGPDNRIYVGHWHSLFNYMSIIEQPDIGGAGCSFCRLCIGNNAPSGHMRFMANMPNYTLGPKTCWPLASSEVLMNKEEVQVYPNPSNDKITFESSLFTISDADIEIYDLLGHKVLQQKLSKGKRMYSISLSSLQLGLYHYKIRVASQVLTGKFIKRD